MWEKLKADIKARFLNFETVRGLWWFPVGAYIYYVTEFRLQDSYEILLKSLAIYMMIDGARKIWVNRVKQTLKFEKKCEEAACSVSKES